MPNIPVNLNDINNGHVAALLSQVHDLAESTRELRASQNELRDFQSRFCGFETDVIHRVKSLEATVGDIRDDVLRVNTRLFESGGLVERWTKALEQLDGMRIWQARMVGKAVAILVILQNIAPFVMNALGLK